MELNQNFVFSQSNLQTFTYCRRRFFLRYVRQLVWPAQLFSNQQAQVDLEAGTRFHQLIHRFFLGFELDLLRKQADHDPDSRMKTWLEAFLASPPSRLGGQLLPETPTTLHLMNYQLSAKADLIHLPKEGSVSIYDWKTSRKLPNQNALKAKLQSKVYPLVIGERYAKGSEPGEIKMVYWEANFPDKPFVFSFQRKEIEALKLEILELITEISSLKETEFTLTSDLKRCAWCEYRSYCDRGGKAAALPEEDRLDLEDYETKIPSDEA